MAEMVASVRVKHLAEIVRQQTEVLATLEKSGVPFRFRQLVREAIAKGRQVEKEEAGG